MTNDGNLDPAWQRIGHVALSTGELVSISVADEQVVVALYAMTAKPADDNELVEPAPVLLLQPDEAETVSGLIMMAAVSGYNHRRPKLRVVTDEDDEHR